MTPRETERTQQLAMRCQQAWAAASRENQPFSSTPSLSAAVGAAWTPIRNLRDALTRLPHMTNHKVPEVTPKAWGKARQQVRRAAQALRFLSRCQLGLGVTLTILKQ